MAKDKNGLKLVEFPERGTESLARYCEHAFSTYSIYHFIAHVAALADAMPVHLKQIIDEDKKPEELPSPIEIATSSPGPNIIQLRRYSKHLSQLMASRLVDNFQCYISEILRECFTTERRVLHSSEPSLSLEYVFGFSDIDELFQDVIDAKVNALSYKGFGELTRWCQSRGIPIQLQDELHTKVSNLIAIRNLIAHNRGIVDKRFVEITDLGGLVVGKPYEVTIEDFRSTFNTLGEAVSEIDNSTRAKFQLKAVALNPDSDDT